MDINYTRTHWIEKNWQLMTKRAHRPRIRDTQSQVRQKDVLEPNGETGVTTRDGDNDPHIR